MTRGAIHKMLDWKGTGTDRKCLICEIKALLRAVTLHPLSRTWNTTSDAFFTLEGDEWITTTLTICILNPAVFELRRLKMPWCVVYMHWYAVFFSGVFWQARLYYLPWPQWEAVLQHMWEVPQFQQQLMHMRVWHQKHVQRRSCGRRWYEGDSVSIKEDNLMSVLSQTHYCKQLQLPHLTDEVLIGNHSHTAQ